MEVAPKNLLISGPTWLEGGMWSGLLVLDAYFLKTSFANWNKLDRDSKPGDAFRARKELILSTTSSLSTIALSGHWLGRVFCHVLTPILPHMMAIAFGGRVIIGFSRLYDTVKEFVVRMVETARSSDPQSVKTLLLKQVVTLFQIALYITFIAWSVVGLMATAGGYAYLAPVVDSLFYHSGVLFLGAILSILFVQPNPSGKYYGA